LPPQAAYPVEEQVTEVLLASATPPHDAGGGVVDGAARGGQHPTVAPSEDEPTHRTQLPMIHRFYLFSARASQ
jgi:hypothetical protein